MAICECEEFDGEENATWGEVFVIYLAIVKVIWLRIIIWGWTTRYRWWQQIIKLPITLITKTAYLCELALYSVGIIAYNIHADNYSMLEVRFKLSNKIKRDNAERQLIEYMNELEIEAAIRKVNFICYDGE